MPQTSDQSKPWIVILAVAAVAALVLAKVHQPLWEVFSLSSWPWFYHLPAMNFGEHVIALMLLAGALYGIATDEGDWGRGGGVCLLILITLSKSWLGDDPKHVCLFELICKWFWSINLLYIALASIGLTFLINYCLSLYNWATAGTWAVVLVLVGSVGVLIYDYSTADDALSEQKRKDAAKAEKDRRDLETRCKELGWSPPPPKRDSSLDNQFPFRLGDSLLK